MADFSNTDDIIDSRDIISRIEELESERDNALIVAGWNMPGYMPENDPATFDDVAGALEYVKENMRQQLEQEHVSMGGELTDEQCADLEKEIDAMECEEGQDFGVIFRNWYYFITENPEPLDADDAEELATLKALAEDCEGCADWEYGEPLIRESYFQQYMDETIADCYDVPKNLPAFMSIVLDYDMLKQDYNEVEYDGATYFIRY